MGLMLRWVLEWFVKVRCGWNWLLIVSILEFCISSVELSDARVRATGVWCIILVHILNICSRLQLQIKIMPCDYFLVFSDWWLLICFYICFGVVLQIILKKKLLIFVLLIDIYSKFLMFAWYIFFQFMRRPWFKL